MLSSRIHFAGTPVRKPGIEDNLASGYLPHFALHEFERVFDDPAHTLQTALLPYSPRPGHDPFDRIHVGVSAPAARAASVARPYRQRFWTLASVPPLSSAQLS